MPKKCITCIIDGSIIIDFLGSLLSVTCCNKEIWRIHFKALPLFWWKKCIFERKHLSYKIFSGMFEGPCYLTPQGCKHQLFLDINHRGPLMRQTRASKWLDKNFRKEKDFYLVHSPERYTSCMWSQKKSSHRTNSTLRTCQRKFILKTPNTWILSLFSHVQSTQEKRFEFTDNLPHYIPMPSLISLLHVELESNSF